MQLRLPPLGTQGTLRCSPRGLRGPRHRPRQGQAYTWLCLLGGPGRLWRGPRFPPWTASAPQGMGECGLLAGGHSACGDVCAGRGGGRSCSEGPLPSRGPLKLVLSILSGSSALFFSLPESGHFGETEADIATLTAEGETEGWGRIMM